MKKFPLLKTKNEIPKITLNISTTVICLPSRILKVDRLSEEKNIRKLKLLMKLDYNKRSRSRSKFK
jgi:hypothetical protein